MAASGSEVNLGSRSNTQGTILAIVRTDSTFERVQLGGGEEAWLGKCIHCNAKLSVSLSGAPLSRATIEHILPRAHGGTDAPANLALACSRCNHQKGARLDNRRLDDPKLQEVIATLRARRQARWREPEE